MVKLEPVQHLAFPPLRRGGRESSAGWGGVRAAGCSCRTAQVGLWVALAQGRVVEVALQQGSSQPAGRGGSAGTDLERWPISVTKWKTHVSEQDAQYYSTWGTIQTQNCIRMARFFESGNEHSD